MRGMFVGFLALGRLALARLLRHRGNLRVIPLRIRRIEAQAGEVMGARHDHAGFDRVIAILRTGANRDRKPISGLGARNRQTVWLSICRLPGSTIPSLRAAVKSVNQNGMQQRNRNQAVRKTNMQKQPDFQSAL